MAKSSLVKEVKVLTTTVGHDMGRRAVRWRLITDLASRYRALREAGSPGGIHSSACSVSCE